MEREAVSMTALCGTKQDNTNENNLAPKQKDGRIESIQATMPSSNGCMTVVYTEKSSCTLSYVP